MKALHIITGLGVGGAEQQLRLLLRHLPVDCDVVTLTNPGSVADGLIADGVRVVHLGMPGNRDLAALPRLVDVIRAGGYDLVHTHLYRACVYGRIAARLAGVRAVVATEHSLGDSQIEGRRLTAGVRALYLASERLGRTTVAVSATVAERLRRWGVPAPRIDVVPNGIDLTRFRFDPVARLRTRERLGLPEDAYVVGGVGRLAPGKRFDDLVGALAQLPDDYWLLLVGDGPEEQVLRRAASEAGRGRPGAVHRRAARVPDGTPGPDLPLPHLRDGRVRLPVPGGGLRPRGRGGPGRRAARPVRLLPGGRGPAPGGRRGRPARTRRRGLLRARPRRGPRAGPTDRTPPAAAHHYDITRSAARLMDVYAATTPAMQSVPVPVAPQGAPSS